MELRHLRYFVAVAEELNFTRAAVRLGTAQPSLSQQIIQLERFVGTPLLVRTKRRVRLTPAGRVFFREARDILGRADRAVELAAEAAVGTASQLSIGMMPAAETTILPKLMPLLATRLPNVRIALHSLAFFDDQLKALRNHTLDLAFLWGPIQAADLIVEPLYDETFVVALPSTHALGRRKQVTVSDLDGLSCVMPAGRTSPSLQQMVADLQQRPPSRSRLLPDADNVLGHLNMVRAGLGFALLPAYVRAIAPKGVTVVDLAWTPAPTATVVVAHLRDGQLPVVETFKRVVREALGDTRRALSGVTRSTKATR